MYVGSVVGQYRFRVFVSVRGLGFFFAAPYGPNKLEIDFLDLWLFKISIYRFRWSWSLEWSVLECGYEYEYAANSKLETGSNRNRALEGKWVHKCIYVYIISWVSSFKVDPNEMVLAWISEVIPSFTSDTTDRMGTQCAQHLKVLIFLQKKEEVNSTFQELSGFL